MGRTVSDAPVTSVRGHLTELRNRLIAVAVLFGIASSLSYAYKDVIIGVLLSPLQGEQLSYLTVGGGFSFIFMLTVWCGVAAVLPFFVYSIYSFISPAMPHKASSKAPTVFVASFLLLVSGALFGYFVAIPNAIQFLLTFADEYVASMLTADSYLSFILAYTVGLGILFQLPLVLVIINWITPLKPTKLLSIERYVIVISFVLAAIVTPTPDVWNQTIIALPLIAMYQLGVFAVALINWREKRQAKKEVVNTVRLPLVKVQHPKPVTTQTMSPMPPVEPVVRQHRTQATIRVPSRQVMDIRPVRPQAVGRGQSMQRSSFAPMTRSQNSMTRAIDGVSTVYSASTRPA